MFKEINEIKSSEVRKNKNIIEEERRLLLYNMFDCRVDHQNLSRLNKSLKNLITRIIFINNYRIPEIILINSGESKKR